MKNILLLPYDTPHMCAASVENIVKSLLDELCCLRHPTTHHPDSPGIQVSRHQLTYSLCSVCGHLTRLHHHTVTTSQGWQDRGKTRVS